MSKPVIVCVDDQREVLASLPKELEPLREFFEIILCESAIEAREVLEECDSEGREVPLIVCDHIMPEKNGIDFLIELKEEVPFVKTKKLLLTGMATHQDTIVAINKASIDHYIEKPWKSEELLEAAQTLITEYLLTSGMDYQPYLSIMDQPTLYRELKKRG